MPAPVVVAEIVRSGFVEGHHYGSVVALTADGSVDWSVGDVEHAILPRSCNKPLQAVGMLRAGLDLDGDLLALAAASHSGEDFHLEGVRRILASAGLDESALQTPAGLPARRAGPGGAASGPAARRSSIAMNCSGKHAAMLATCVANGWDTATYLDPDHPLQVAIAATFAELTGEEVEVVAVDGCGAPLLSASLVGLARAFRRIATGRGRGGARLADAIRRHPEYTSGIAPRRGRPAARRARRGRQGRRGVLLRGRPRRRPGGGAQDRRRRPSGASGADGRRPRAHGRARRRPTSTRTPYDGRASCRLLGGGRPVGEIRASF